jgi:uncharacterized membrane-anchored protein YhcB (DUF1043 family)
MNSLSVFATIINKKGVLMTGQFWVGLIVGLVIGWIIEWLIDRAYWRSRYRRIEAQLVSTKDNLRDIKGVGKVLEGRLNEAGIYSFEAMAALTQEELEMIAGDAKKLANERDLIKQAGKYVRKKKKKK